MLSTAGQKWRRTDACSLVIELTALSLLHSVYGGNMIRKRRYSLTKEPLRIAPLVVALVAAQTIGFAPAAIASQAILVATVTLKDGMPPSKKAEYEKALKAACGELGEAARSRDVNAKVVGGWSDDQYATQVDPQAKPKKYGLHLTVETFKGPQRTGRWHLYESGSVWVDRKGTGKNIVESCHS
jgi:hypothetical protein